MAEALQESKLDVPVLFYQGRAAGQQPGCVAGARGRGEQKPSQGLTSGISGERSESAACRG